MNLLSTNTKLAKGQDLGYLAVGLSLLPGNKSGREACPNRGACFATCLDSSGRGSMPNVIAARLRRHEMLNEHPDAFLALLDLETEKAKRKAERKGLRLAVRLNVLSDLPWEEMAPDLFTGHPDVTFYDYTKSPDRAWDNLQGLHPSNYELVYSASERTSNPWAAVYLTAGGRIAYVDRPGTPDPYWAEAARRGEDGLSWADGDAHDLVFLQPRGAVLALTPKGKLKKAATKFA